MPCFPTKSNRKPLLASNGVQFAIQGFPCTGATPFRIAVWHALRECWVARPESSAVLGDLAYVGTTQLMKNALLSLGAEGEEVSWDVTV